MKQNIYDNPQFYQMYLNLRKSKVTSNDFIEQPAIKQLLPDLTGLDILDLGCGFGELSNYCLEKGAKHVTGVDISIKMLNIANILHPKVSFIESAMEDAQFNENQFDLVVSSLALHYIQNLDELIKKISIWLKPNGYLVFSIQHPMKLSRKNLTGWIKDENGNKLYWPIDDYGDEGIREVFWGVDGVIKYHRKFSTLMNVLAENGFYIQKVEEPESIPEGIKKLPKLSNEKRRSSFIVIKSRNCNF